MSNFTCRSWRVLCWNVRGLNSDKRNRVIRQKIDENQAVVICMQETKIENFDMRYVREFRPKRFDNFAFSPSVGASRGILVLWNSSVLHGTLTKIQQFVLLLTLFPGIAVIFGHW